MDYEKEYDMTEERYKEIDEMSDSDYDKLSKEEQDEFMAEVDNKMVLNEVKESIKVLETICNCLSVLEPDLAEVIAEWAKSDKGLLALHYVVSMAMNQERLKSLSED